MGGAGHRSRDRDRDDRADAARGTRAGAGEHRRAAAHLRPAGLPPLARRAPVGAPELEQLVDVIDRLIVDSTEWDDLPARLRPARGVVPALRGLGHRVGADVALARPPRDAVARDRRRRHRATCGNRRASVARLRLAPLAPRPPRHRPRARPGGEAARRRRRSTATQSRYRRAIRRPRATSSPTSSNASRPIRSTRPPSSPRSWPRPIAAHKARSFLVTDCYLVLSCRSGTKKSRTRDTCRVSLAACSRSPRAFHAGSSTRSSGSRSEPFRSRK